MSCSDFFYSPVVDRGPDDVGRVVFHRSGAVLSCWADGSVAVSADAVEAHELQPASAVRTPGSIVDPGTQRGDGPVFQFQVRFDFAQRFQNDVADIVELDL